MKTTLWTASVVGIIVGSVLLNTSNNSKQVAKNYGIILCSCVVNGCIAFGVFSTNKKQDPSKLDNPMPRRKNSN
jgi:hypothetical protein